MKKYLAVAGLVLMFTLTGHTFDGGDPVPCPPDTTCPGAPPHTL